MNKERKGRREERNDRRKNRNIKNIYLNSFIFYSDIIGLL